MPYSEQHKQETRARIVESARILFNRHGFQAVTIDMVMEKAGLTRGGFYNHFKSKDALFEAAVSSFLSQHVAHFREEAESDSGAEAAAVATQMIAAYLSSQHLANLDDQCPLIALPSDVARSNGEAQASYQRLLNGMVDIFELALAPSQSGARERALSLAALCVGGMVLARTLPDTDLADEMRLAAHGAAMEYAGFAKQAA